MSSERRPVTPAEQRLEIERMAEISPAQPTGPDRIDGDEVRDEAPDTPTSAHVKHDHSHRMEH